MNDILMQLQDQLQSVNASLKSGGISDALQTELIANQMLLQGWVNQLVAGKFVSNEDIQKMEQALDTSKNKTLEAQAARTKKTITLFGIGIIVAIGGIIFYYYKTKKR